MSIFFLVMDFIAKPFERKEKANNLVEIQLQGSLFILFCHGYPK
jgi:hypothetical protein